MSSKPRKKKKPRTPSSSGGAHGSAAVATPTHGADHDDEAVHVPEGKSPFKFLFLIGLLVFLLVIFIVPGAIMGALGQSDGPGANETFVSWDGADGELRELTYQEFMFEKRSLNSALDLDVYTKILLGVMDRTISDEATARLLVIDELARSAGVRITDDDLRTYLVDEVIGRTFRGDEQQFRSYAASIGGLPSVQEALRRTLRIKRYGQLLGHVAAAPDSERIEEYWSDEHVEVAYQFVALETDAVQDLAMTKVPDDATLEAWWNERDESTRQTYIVQERRRAEIARFHLPENLDDDLPDGVQTLLSRYPDEEAPPDSDPVEWAEERAHDYYNKIFPVRFRRPEPAEEPGETEDDEVGDAATEDAATEDAGEATGDDDADEAGDPGEADGDADDADDADEPDPNEADASQAPETPFFPFEEVKDRCLVEGPVYFALDAWLLDIQKRKGAGEEVDLAAEAKELGLEHYEQERGYSQIEYSEDPELGGVYTASAVLRAEVGEFGASLALNDKWFGVVRLLERFEPSMPEFADVRDRVADDWAFDWAKNHIEGQLLAVRESFEEIPDDDEAESDEGADPNGLEDDEEPAVRRRADEAAFLAACEAAGLEVKRRDWLDKAATQLEDPHWSEPAHEFLRGHPEYADMEEGELAETAFDRFEDWVYLVRLAGTRPVPLERMSPAQYQSYRVRSARDTSTAVQEFLRSEDFDARHSIQIHRQDEEPDGDGDADDGGGDDA